MEFLKCITVVDFGLGGGGNRPKKVQKRAIEPHGSWSTNVQHQLKKHSLVLKIHAAAVEERRARRIGPKCRESIRSGGPPTGTSESL